MQRIVNHCNKTARDQLTVQNIFVKFMLSDYSKQKVEFSNLQIVIYRFSLSSISSGCEIVVQYRPKPKQRKLF